MPDDEASEARRIAAKIYGALCPECGISWSMPSPDCPHKIRNLHPPGEGSEARPALWSTFRRSTDVTWECLECGQHETGTIDVAAAARAHAARMTHVVRITWRKHEYVTGMRH